MSVRAALQDIFVETVCLTYTGDMHPHISELLADLDASRAAVKAAVGTVPAEQRGTRPGPDRWSVNEILEHLALVERAFAGNVTKAIAAAREAGVGAEQGPKVGLDAEMRARFIDRTARREAPEAVVPTGTLDEAAAWKALDEARAAFRSALLSGDGMALGDARAEHKRWGPLSVYQWAEILALHEHRHAAQIAAIAEKA